MCFLDVRLLTLLVVSVHLSLLCIHRIIDNKSLRLIADSSESSPSKSDKDHLDNNLRGISPPPRIFPPFNVVNY
jgi:hypothetical protein